MATCQLDGVVRRLREVTSRHAAGERSDAELLREFVCSGDESAFTALVRRHGPLVLGVCRRVLRNGADADDCFQATFLVLVRKARSLRRPESLANWLYGVAYRVARKARVAAARRQAKEALAMSRTETSAQRPEELLAALDQELAALPDKYRVLLVRCDLGGETRKEVARDLGYPEGTVASRLARARALLARRLSRRAPGLSAGALTVALTETGKAGVSAALVSLTVWAAVGQAAVPAKVLALTEGVLKAMFLTKLKPVVLVLTVAVLAAVTGVLAAGGDGGAERPPDPARPAPVKKAGVSDAEFIRRACLEIRGSLPTDIEVHYFLQDTNPKKRTWLVGKLKEEAALRGEGSKVAQPANTPQGGAAQLEGWWEVSRLVLHGEEALPGKFEKAELAFFGNKVRFRLHRQGQRERPDTEMDFLLDPKRQPHGIDFIPRQGPLEGKALRGIYEVKGDNLRLCFSDQPEAPRPSGFRVSAGANLYLVIARRPRARAE
jgi:RNA polymerase sigma factor (sigma-70 family)